MFDAAASRPDPIPVYAEMGSVNPTVFLPRALEHDAAVIAKGLVQSITMGVGQFCTNPGVVLTVAGETTEHFLHAVADAMREAAAHPMLHSGIRESYDEGISRHAATAGVDLVVQGKKGEGHCDGRPALLRCSAATFLAEPVLQEEVFGPCTIVVVSSAGTFPGSHSASNWLSRNALSRRSAPPCTASRIMRRPHVAGRRQPPTIQTPSTANGPAM